MAGAGESLSLALATTKGNIMTGVKFDEIVKNRANERVQEKLKVFKRQVCSAFRNLMGEIGLRPSGENNEKDKEDYNRAILQRMLDDNTISFKKAWPSLLWREEEVLVSKELLSMMDEMQKACLSSSPNEDDCKSD